MTTEELEPIGEYGLTPKGHEGVDDLNSLREISNKTWKLSQL